MYLCYCSSLLGTFFDLCDALLDGLYIHRKHVGCFFRGLILGGLFSLVVFLLNEPQLFIESIKRAPDLNFRSFGDGWLDNANEKGFEDVEQSLVIGLLEDDVEILNLDLDALHLEESISIFGIGRDQFHVERQAVSAHKNVHDALISNTRKSFFLFDPIRNIFEVTLNLRNMNRDSVSAVVVNFLSTEAPESVCLDFEEVRHQILGFNYEIFDNGVNLWIAYFNAWDLTLDIKFKEVIPERSQRFQRFQGE